MTPSEAFLVGALLAGSFLSISSFIIVKAIEWRENHG